MPNKITCNTDGLKATTQSLALDPVHTRFVEEEAATALTAEIEFGNNESAEFEVYDFTDGGFTYVVDVDRVVKNADGTTTVIESWVRNGNHCTSGEYLQTQTLGLSVTATETTSSGGATGNSLTTACQIHVRPKGRPG